MRYLVSLIVYITSIQVHSFSGDMGGGRSLVIPNTNIGSTLSVDQIRRTLTIPNTSLEAVISREGIYARPIEILEGYEKFKGIQTNFDKTFIDLHKPTKIDIDKVILIDGTIINIGDIYGKHGGDMGGG